MSSPVLCCLGELKDGVRIEAEEQDQQRENMCQNQLPGTGVHRIGHHGIGDAVNAEGIGGAQPWILGDVFVQLHSQDRRIEVKVRSREHSIAISSPSCHCAHRQATISLKSPIIQISDSILPLGFLALLNRCLESLVILAFVKSGALLSSSAHHSTGIRS